MNTVRLGSGRQYRRAPLVEMPLPLAYDPALLPGAAILGEDGQIYESMRNAVSGLYEWKVRAQGERGPAVELQKSITHLQWRVQGSTGPWTDLVPLADLLGPAGEQGDQGPSGPGFAFQGRVATVGALPTVATQGHAYLVTATGDLHIYSGTAWINSGPIQGPKGDDGDPGSEVELRKTATEIQWRLVGAASWTTLVLIADLKGDAGTSVELRKTATEIQWRLVGAANWITVVLLDDIQGPVGDQGLQGPPGPGFSYQGSVATVGALPTPSTQGFAYLVTGTGNLHIYNGIAWVNAGPLQGPKGDQGNQGLQGPPGSGFSYQGTVATVAALPNPSTQGFAFRVVATGDLHIYNGTAWVNAGPLQGPKGDQGDTGDQGPPGPGFSYQGTVATVAALPNPSTQGFAFRVVATGDLHIYNGIAWVNAGPLQGPKGDQGNQGDQGNPGSAATIGVGTVSTGAAGSLVQVTNSGTTSAAVLNFTIPRGDKGNQGDQGNPGTNGREVQLQVSGSQLQWRYVGDTTWNNLGAAYQPLYPTRQTLTASSGVITIDVTAGQAFITSAAINGATTINLANLANLPANGVWWCILRFAYTSGAISWFTGNTGYAVKWDGGSAPELNVGQQEAVVIEVTGGTSVIEVAALGGRS